MPSRRRTRRAPRPARRRRLRKRSTRTKKKLRKPQKPRLVRRYIKDRQRLKPANLRTSGQLLKGNKNVNQNADVKPPGPNEHNVIPNGGDRKNPPSPPTPPPNPGPGEVAAVPNPTPDSGNQGNGAPAITGSPLLGDIIYTPQVAIPPTVGPAIPKVAAGAPSFSPLPPLPSLVISRTSAISTTSLVFGTSSLFLPVETDPPSVNTSVNDVQTSSSTKGRPINLAVIILLAVGSGVLFLGLCILAKMCTRPRRKDRPKPSLPIFKDVEPDDDFYETESKRESPLFGGKERFSPMPGTIGAPLWNWVPYPHQRLTQPPPPSAQPNLSYNAPNVSRANPPSTHTQSTLSSDLSIPQPQASSMTTAISQRTMKRQSTASLTPYSGRLYANIGQAITYDQQQTPLTGDGQDVLKQSKSKSSVKRRSQIVREEKSRNRESTATDIGLAYDGTDIGSPSAMEYISVDKTPVLGNHEGRERIRSGYFAAGTYPRISTMPGTSYSIATATRVNVGQRNSFSRDKFVSPQLQRSNSKKQRDTQALTYALGLATPEAKYVAQPSPQPTLYPDDSMSVVESRKPKKRKQVESVPDVPVVVPEDNQRMRRSSGLMGMDFGVSRMSLSAMAMAEAGDEESFVAGDQRDTGGYSYGPGGVMEGQQRQRSGIRLGSASASGSTSADRPPRVPSPPALPSLAQMAMAQHNSEAYANYRSPTYSLYGLYETSDRKSVVR